MPDLRVAVGGYFHNLNVEQAGGGRYILRFRYNPALIAEVKAMEGARWNPDQKYWTIAASERNQIALDFLRGVNPYARYFQEIKEYIPNRETLMKHQVDGYNFALNKRQCLLAMEPGTGKTLIAIEAIEASGHDDWLWVGPKSALRAVEIEFFKWEAKIWPKLVTYDSLKKVDHVYKGIVCDESQKLKNPNTQRYDAAKNLVRAMREHWDEPYVILMSGTPAPNSPADYWSQMELIAPGFIKESTVDKFKKRMGLIVQEESLAGGKFPKLICWWSDEKLCRHCGKFKEDICHDLKAIDLGYDYHEWASSINEVEHLYKVMQPMVTVVFKKDVLKELPDKHYRIIKCEPTPDILRAAKLVVVNAKNAATSAIQLREISDGFLYREKAQGIRECELCQGRKVIEGVFIRQLEYCPDCSGTEIQDGKCIACGTDLYGGVDLNVEQECPRCGGTGEVPKYTRVADQVPCPKEEILKELLEEYEDIGRVVIYAGFTGSVDRCIEICQKAEWKYIRIDGRGWLSNLGESIKETDMLQTFQDRNKKVKKLAIIAQPDSGGLGLTLTASPCVIFYSNSTLPGSRSQSEDRIHRPGMDVNKGATIIDIIHLPTDQLILDRLKMKQKIQNISLGEFQRALET